MNSEKISLENENYKVRAQYPKLQSPKNQKLVKDFVMKKISEFQNSYGTDEEEYKHKLKINYKIYNSHGLGKNLKSIVFKLKYFEGKVLENYFFKTFVFDKDSEERISISDILDTELKRLVVAQVVRDKLKDLIAEDYYDKDRVLRATQAKAKNYKNFYFDNSEFHLLFSPYQVADFEAGYFDVVVEMV